MHGQMDSVSFVTQLWRLFRAIKSGTLNELHATPGCSVSTVMQAIDNHHGHTFLIRSLQLDAFTM
jgi:hypothetical protein